MKNSFDAHADKVVLYFGKDCLIIADNGDGMSYEDVKTKWLSVAYSAKREANQSFRDVTAARGHFAGSKGIGRFSTDRLGATLIMETRPKPGVGPVHHLEIDWSRFEQNDLERFEEIPLDYSERADFDLPLELRQFASRLKHGTIITVRDMRQRWDRDTLIRLKAALAKLINPFGSDIDAFDISIIAPDEMDNDKAVKERSARRGEKPTPRELVNGKVGNFIFADLKQKTTYIEVKIEGNKTLTKLTDRGELVYLIREDNAFPLLSNAQVHCTIYYLNTSAKNTFARRVGLPSVQFGSLFLFRNGFRVFPVGEPDDDWFGFNRRKQQGYSRYLGPREVIGRVDVEGDPQEFQEASSRNQGLIETPAVKQLQDFVMEQCLKRLERYVVPVSWVDKGDAKVDDLSRLQTDPGRARISAVVANLANNERIELLEYNHDLVDIINERSTEFEASIESLKVIAEKSGNKALLKKISAAEKRYEDLQRAEAEARRIADQEREAAQAAQLRAEKAEATVELVRAEAEAEKRRSHFMESLVDVDAATILNLHHQVTIYAIKANQQIENFLSDTADRKSIPRDEILKSFEQLSYLNKKIYAVARFAARATFRLDSERITTNLAAYTYDYIHDVSQQFTSSSFAIVVESDGAELVAAFNPIDISIIVENLVSNADRARASRITFKISALGKDGIQILASDNGRGLPKEADRDRIFEMGYTTSRGSGLGLYHTRQILGEMGGTIELADPVGGRGTAFLIKIVPKKKAGENAS